MSGGVILREVYLQRKILDEYTPREGHPPTPQSYIVDDLEKPLSEMSINEIKTLVPRMVAIAERFKIGPFRIASQGSSVAMVPTR